jgi:hypothetical protein
LSACKKMVGLLSFRLDQIGQDLERWIEWSCQDK